MSDLLFLKITENLRYGIGMIPVVVLSTHALLNIEWLQLVYKSADGILRTLLKIVVQWLAPIACEQFHHNIQKSLGSSLSI